MGKIHELPEILADQIAAGEVIERPASVVKELVENAIDAHSTRIDIAVEDSGLTKISVIDNGFGIEDIDVELAFQRHATSKITDRDDLFRVQTLGFRGEALPSIASIADVILTTVPQGCAMGSIVHFKGGKLLSHSSFGGRQGTQVTVSQLFFNTPARLKYLRSPQTELAVISDYVDRLALGHPEIAISLTNNGHYLLKTAGNNSLIQVASAIYGVKNARQLIEFKGHDNDFNIHGLTSLPQLTRASKNYITLLLNGRAVKNNELSGEIIKGYGSKLMVGRYPLAILNVTLDPLLVDVNVHPTKQEVRISKEKELQKLINDTIAQRLGNQSLIQNAVENLKTHSVKYGTQLQMPLHENKLPYQSTSQRQQVIDALLGNLKKRHDNFKPQYFAHPLKIYQKSQLLSLKEWDKRYCEVPLIQKEPLENKEVKVAPVKPSVQAFPHLKYLGQVHGTYLLAEASDGLYILDQHAAQERIKYEYYRHEIGEKGTVQQKMLVPLVLTYSVSDALKIEENLPKLIQLGIHLEDFGQNTYIIREHPSWIPQGKEELTIKDLIEKYVVDPHLTIAKFREDTAKMISCKQAIKANHHLEPQQAQTLLDQLKECENPFNCPHGRPTIIKFTNKDLEKMFKRIQDPHHSLRENKNLGE